MLIGCCVNMLPKESSDAGAWYAPEIKAAGYDYLELPIGQVAGQSNVEFEEMRSYLKEVSLPVYACNNFFTADIKLVGEQVDAGAVRAFYQRALERAACLGARYVVFGSPWSKSCPEGFSRDRAFDQLAQWCCEIGDEARKQEVVIALEPNNRGETNMINTFSDVVALAKAADHPNIRCLQDYYHLRAESDTVDSLLEYGKDYLVHTHFARFAQRGFPASMEEDPYYQTYFDALKALGYCGGISMEGFPESRESFPREAADTCHFLRSASR